MIKLCVTATWTAKTSLLPAGNSIPKMGNGAYLGQGGMVGEGGRVLSRQAGEPDGFAGL